MAMGKTVSQNLAPVRLQVLPHTSHGSLNDLSFGETIVQSLVRPARGTLSRCCMQTLQESLG